MPFQFYCPQGHLLQGDESQQGQQSQCPMCGTVFLTPMLAGQTPPAPQQPAVSAPQEPAFQQPAPHPPAFQMTPTFQNVEQPAEAAPPPEPEPPRIVRIPCPSGHVLETPSDMFGQQALCPYCNVQFELRYEDSQEYHAEQAEKKRLKEEQFNKNLLKWAIRAAALVGLSLVIMIAYSIYTSWSSP